jgi:hypothetical protein
VHLHAIVFTHADGRVVTACSWEKKVRPSPATAPWLPVILLAGAALYLAYQETGGDELFAEKVATAAA